MKIILADSELELVSDFTKRNKIFVDNGDDILERGKHKFIALAKDYQRAGRPDIPYVFHSILSNYIKKGIEYTIHTRNNKIISWQDLMGAETFQEFKERVKPLLRSSREMSLKDLVKTGKKPIVLSQYGHMKEISYLKNFDLIVMGGFPEGDYISDLSVMEKVSISSEELTVPDVLVRVSQIFL